ncbi:hypothetical protein [Hoeflea sp.]|uniref:hypothetical protein n=1 Tax=Hoeflea sp. TaxID=1940281 RepID=UPI0037483F99
MIALSSFIRRCLLNRYQSSRIVRHSGIALLFGLSTMLATPAPALQKFEQYRIMGSEISAVRIGPQEVEDPATLIIELVSASSDPVEILLESDGDLDECKLTIEYAIGDNASYIQITQHLTADTMNGVMVTECVRISIPGY